MTKKKQNPDDVARYQYFQQWVREQADTKGWNIRSQRDRETMAANYNALRDDDENAITESAFRQITDRKAIGTIRRDTCRTVAMGLGLDMNDVLEAAGYQREDRHNQIDDMPTGIRATYGKLSPRYRQKVHDCITEAWEAQVADESVK